MVTHRTVDKAQILIILVGLFIFGGGYLATLDERFAYIIAGMLSYLVLMLVCIVLNEDYVSPMRLVAYAVLLGCFLRNIFLAFSKSERVPFLLNGMDIDYYSGLSFLVPIFLALLSISYAARSRLLGSFRSGQKTNGALISLSGNSQIIIFVLGLVFGLFSIIFFVKEVGISSVSLSTISNKRPVELDGGGYTSLGHVRILYKFTEAAFYVFLISSIREQGRTIREWFFLSSLFIIFSVVPFLNSSRSEIALLFINSAIILYFKNSLNLKKAIVGVVVVLFIVTSMGYLRALAQTENHYVGKRETVTESVIGSGNFLDMSRTVFIMKNSGHIDLFLGETYLYWLSGFVPRVIWPEKPNVSLGPMVKSQVYGQTVRNHGYPPGVIGEAVLNFGSIGFLVVPVIIGFLMSFLKGAHRRAFGSDIFALIYISVAWRFSFGLIGLNFSQAVMQVFMALVPVLLIVLVLKRLGAIK